MGGAVLIVLGGNIYLREFPCLPLCPPPGFKGIYQILLDCSSCNVHISQVLLDRNGLLRYFGEMQGRVNHFLIICEMGGAALAVLGGKIETL